MPDTTLNVAALREIVPVLYELERQERFYMNDWAAGLVNPHADSYTECGTQFCMAGAKAVFDGWRPQYRMTEVWSQRLDRYVRRAIATGYFLPSEYRHEPLSFLSESNARPAQQIASEAFGLNEGQVEFLFHGCHLTRVSDLEKRIEYVISNPLDPEPRDTYPQVAVDAEYAHRDADEAASEKAERRAEPFTWGPEHSGEFDELLGDEPTA